jgi:Collagen triple helix repeat (20 copies)
MNGTQYTISPMIPGVRPQDPPDYDGITFVYVFTEVLTPWVQPPVQGNATIVVANNQGFAAGMTVVIENGGYYEVVSTANLGQMTVMNFGTNYNVPPGTGIAPGKVTTTSLPGPPGGIGPQGPQGPDGPDGPPGPPLTAQGVVATVSDLPATGNPGDLWTVAATGHAYVWNPSSFRAVGGWVDMGQWEGPTGPQGVQGPQGQQGVQGATGATGPQGNQGPAGPTGATGPQGPIGNTGPAGSTGPQGPIGNTGPQGIAGPTGPVGPQGPAGPAGADGTSVVLKGAVPTQADLPATGNTYGDLWITSDTGDGWVWTSPGSWVNVGPIQGPAGPAGPAGATGATGPEGPQGATGSTGATGPPGPTGPTGNTGPAGTAATVSVGTTTTGAPGSNANVTNSGTSSAAVLNFTIPQGVAGATGATGAQGPAGATGPTGAQGPAGATGPAGAPGPPFPVTSLTSSFVMASGLVTVAVASSAGFPTVGWIYIQNAGWFTMVSIPDATHLQLSNTGYIGNAASGTTIPNSSGVWLQGPLKTVSSRLTSACTVPASGSLANAFVEHSDWISDGQWVSFDGYGTAQVPVGGTGISIGTSQFNFTSGSGTLAPSQTIPAGTMVRLAPDPATVASPTVTTTAVFTTPAPNVMVTVQVTNSTLISPQSAVSFFQGGGYWGTFVVQSVPNSTSIVVFYVQPAGQTMSPIQGNNVPAGAQVLVGQPLYPADSAGMGLLGKLSGNATDYVGGDNACHGLVAAIQPTIWAVRLRSINVLGNPNFEVDQFNTTTTLKVVAGQARTSADRWMANAGGVVTTAYVGHRVVPVNFITVPGTNFYIARSYLELAVQTTLASPAAGDYYFLQQNVEGAYSREVLGDVTSLALLALSTQSGGSSFSICIRDAGTKVSYIIPVTIPQNVWTMVTFPNIPTFSSANSASYGVLPGVLGYQLGICLAAGATYTAPSNNAWVNGNYLAASGNNALSKTGSIYLGFIQHEPGPLCTTLIDKPFSQNLDECLRYYAKSQAYGIAPFSAAMIGWVGQLVSGTASIRAQVQFQKRMAKAPTIRTAGNTTTTGQIYIDGITTNNQAVSSISVIDSGITAITLSATQTPTAQYGSCIGQWDADTGW